MELAFYTAASVSMGCSLMAVLQATLCNVWGPGLLIMGDDEEHMAQAVSGMRSMQKYILWSFASGVFFLHISGIFYSWVAFSKESCSIMVSAVLSTFVVLFVSVVYTVGDKFSLPDGVLDHLASATNATPLLSGAGGNVYH